MKKTPLHILIQKSHTNKKYKNEEPEEMKGLKNAVALGITGAIVGAHVYMLMSPRKQRKIEDALLDTVLEMKDMSEEMVRIVKNFR
jgi:hypothetical protein